MKGIRGENFTRWNVKDDGNIFDLSDGNFTIINNDITLISPNGGESWLTGTSQEITWSDNITGDVKIELFKTGAFNSTIAVSTQSDGSFDWNIPSGTIPDSDYKVKINSVTEPSLNDFSDDSFCNADIEHGSISSSSTNDWTVTLWSHS